MPMKGSAKGARHDIYANEETDVPARGQAIVETGIALGLTHDPYCHKRWLSKADSHMTNSY